VSKKKQKAKTDPYATREAEKYENPIPSREYIMELLGQSKKTLGFDAIAALLQIDDPVQLEALSRRLKAMCRDGQLMFGRRKEYGLANKMNLIAGRVIAHRDGFGFLVPDSGEGDIFLTARQMQKVFHGDRALVRIEGQDRRGRDEGAIVEVLERNTEQVVGRLVWHEGVPFVMPESKYFPQDILILPSELKDAKTGSIVNVEIVSQPTARSCAVGRIIEVLGAHMDPGMEIDIAVRAHGLPYAWPADVEEEARHIPDRVTPAAKKKRLDIRHIPLVTIDGPDAKDFDDAVYCERTEEGWRLVVAIADVAYYVKEDSALDREAAARGNSAYFPQRVIPMLPEVLSNGLCSLNPKVERLCMVCDVSISSRGKILSYEFYEGVMQSKARLTYGQVAAMVVDQEQAIIDKYQKLYPHLQDLYTLYKVLHKRRQSRGALDFEIPETKILFDKKGKIEKIIPTQRNDAHRLIEECMLVANVCAAEILLKNKITGLFRVHQGPDPDKLIDVRQFLGELGLQLKGGNEPTPKDYATLIAQITGRPDFAMLQTVLLRSLSQAVYNPENQGHFGLAYDAYTHFTSPIRRYPDLLVHRAIKHIISGKKAKTFFYSEEKMAQHCAHCSATERRADEASRDVIDWLKCEYMQDKLGQEFDGIITGVTGFGLFVELKEVYVEGLIHVTSLNNDYYQFDPLRHQLLGERSGVRYQLGNPVRVRLAGVNLEDRKIDFDLVETPKPGRGRKKKS
jgi:ribonuclease R